MKKTFGKDRSGWELYRYFAWLPTLVPTWQHKDGPVIPAFDGGKERHVWVWLRLYYGNCYNEWWSRQLTAGRPVEADFMPARPPIEPAQARLAIWFECSDRSRGLAKDWLQALLGHATILEKRLVAGAPEMVAGVLISVPAELRDQFSHVLHDACARLGCRSGNQRR